jgi:hypothetical protein
MIGMIKAALKNRRVDTTAPPMLGPDRAPTFKQSEDCPLFATYSADQLNYPNVMLPTVPNSVGGPQNFNSDCARQPQAEWDRSDNRLSIRDMISLLGHTGLDHV